MPNVKMERVQPTLAVWMNMAVIIPDQNTDSNVDEHGSNYT
jgi:hypothetical protein